VFSNENNKPNQKCMYRASIVCPDWLFTTPKAHNPKVTNFPDLNLEVIEKYSFFHFGFIGRDNWIMGAALKI